MFSYLFDVIVDGLDTDDGDAVAAFDEVDEVLLLSEVDDTVTFHLEVCAASPEAAVRSAVWVLESTVPGVSVREIALDLVAAADIADRCGVSRQSVTNWASGRRTGDPFPAPIGRVAGGTRIWAWSAVLPWLRARGRWSDEERTLPYHSVVVLNALLLAERLPGRLAQTGDWHRPALQVSGRPRVAVTSDSVRGSPDRIKVSADDFCLAA